MVLPRRSLSLETAAMVHWLACKRGFWAACYWLDHLNCMLPVRREVHQMAANASFSIQIRHDGALIRGIGREWRLRGAWSRQAIPARLLWGLDRKHRDDFHAAAKLRWAHWLRGPWAHWSIGRCSQCSIYDSTLLGVCAAFYFFLFLTTVFAASLLLHQTATPCVKSIRSFRSFAPTFVDLHIPLFIYPPCESKTQALVGFDTEKVLRTNLSRRDSHPTLLTEPIYTASI